MTKTELNKLSKEEIIELAVKQNEEMDLLKGYKSGLTRKMLETFNSKMLIDCYLKNQKTLKKLAK